MSSAQDQHARFSVELKGPEREGQHYEIGPIGLLVGRSSVCDVVLRSREVSRRHGYFYADGEALYVEDLGSRNGVQVNGQPVRKQRLHGGDVVAMGRISFVVQPRVKQGGLIGLLAGLRSSSAARGPARRLALPAFLSQPGGSLALASLAFGVMSYVHWVFGLCAVVLAAVAYYETRRSAFPVRQSVLAGGIVLGLAGAALNGWFGAVVPRLRDAEQLRARAGCRQNLAVIAQAIRQYRNLHGGRFPTCLEELVLEELLAEEHTRCPGPLLMQEQRGGSYLYVPPPAGAPDEPYAPLVCDASMDNHQGHGGWVLRRNGRVDWVYPPQFGQLLSEWAEHGAVSRPDTSERPSSKHVR